MDNPDIWDGRERRRPDPAHAAAIEGAVAAGIRSAVADSATWDAAAAAMRQHAQSKAGGWLLGGVGALLNRAAWLIVIAVAVYMLGGWAALARLAQGHGGTS